MNNFSISIIILISLLYNYNTSDAAIHINKKDVNHVWIFKTYENITYCHMSTIEYIAKYNLLITAFQASKYGEGHNDQSIYMSISKDKGLHWSNSIKIISSNNKYAVWGPILYWQDEINRLLLCYSRSGAFNIRTPVRNYPGGDIYCSFSYDLGHSWQDETKILSFYSKIRGNISKVTANKPIKLENNQLVIPFWQEKHTNLDTGLPCSGVLLSNDNGETWSTNGFMSNTSTWLIEPTIYSYKSNEITMLMRSQSGYIWQAIFNGDTWTQAKPTQFLNPDSKVFAFSSSNNTVYLSYNPSKDMRSPLSIVQYPDRLFNAILDEGGVQNFAYPTSVQVENQILTTYSASTSQGIRLAILTT